MSYLLSPHDDDAALFAAFTCLRERPTIVIVADSYVQPARGEVGCSAEERALETEKAHAILDCPTIRLGLRDDALTFDAVRDALLQLPANGDLVYAPALEGGHAQHDLVTTAGLALFGDANVRCYSTYAKLSQYLPVDLSPIGTTEIEWTRPELALKQRALSCYESQRRVNPMHFAAVEEASEWLSGPLRLHLGCGDRVYPSWMNIDRYPTSPSVTGCDLSRDPIAAQTDSIDYIFSEDFLEHLPPERRVSILNEMWRVLVPGGVMEHYVPNAGSQNDFGSPSHLSHWNLQTFEHVDVDSYRWDKDRTFEGIHCGFTKVSADLLNWRVEADGIKRAQSLRVRYRAVK